MFRSDMVDLHYNSQSHLIVHAHCKVVWPQSQECRLCGDGNPGLAAFVQHVHDSQLLQ
jgi:hypothetical protein